VTPRTDAAWTAYSLATGFVADVAALALSAAVSEDVSATIAGVVIAAAILELAPLGSDLVLKRSIARMHEASAPEERGANALAALAALAFGTAWIVAGVAVADWLLPNFDIAGFWPYVGTVALVGAATVAIYLPLHFIKGGVRCPEAWEVRWASVRECHPSRLGSTHPVGIMGPRYLPLHPTIHGHDPARARRMAEETSSLSPTPGAPSR
jgi:hypothetical protein